MDLKIYIAGKITGEEPVACKAKFTAAEKKLKELGVPTVINPLNLGIPASWNWTQSREICLSILKEKANAVFMLNDWTDSEGAMEEIQYARQHGYKIFLEDETEAIQRLVKPKWVDTTRYEFP